MPIRKSVPANPGHILVLGDYRQTVTVVRSLARAGYTVTLGTDDTRSSTALSRHVARVWSYARGDALSSARFCDLVELQLRAERPEFVFVVGETQLRLLSQRAAAMDALATWVMPRWEAVRRSFDKRSMFALCNRLGIPTAPWTAFNGAPAWRRQAGEIGYPMVIKRCDSSAQVNGRKALIVRSPEELEEFLQNIDCDPNPGALLMQKFVTGIRHNCHIGAAGGDIVAYFEQRVVRTDELDMTGIGIEGVSVEPSANLRAWCERLTRSLGYNGIGCIQFLVDAATGEVSFLEINPRMDSTAALPYRLGCDFPCLAVELARRQRDRATPVPEFPQSYPAGRRYHWLYGDMLSWHDARRQKLRSGVQLAAWALRSAVVALTSHHLTWDLRDPLPTLHEFWKQFSVALGRRVKLQSSRPFIPQGRR